MRHAIALLLIAALSLVTLSGAGAALTAGEDGIAVTEETVFGDSSAAQGLTVTYRTDIHTAPIGWEITAGFEEGGLSAKSRFLWRPKADERIQIDLYNRNTSNMAPDALEVDETLVGSRYTDARDIIPNISANVRLVLMCRDVAERTPAGSRRTETVRLSDYGMEYFDWDVEARRGPTAISFSAQDRDLLRRVFSVDAAGYFLIITVEKDREGYITGIHTRLTDAEVPPWEEVLGEGQEFDLSGAQVLDNRTVTALDERGMWLFPSVLDGEGRELVSFPEGSGLYFVPFSEKGLYAVDTKEMQLLTPCAGTPVSLKLREGGRLLELIRSVDGGYVITAIDPESGEIIGESTLFEGGDTGVYTVIEGEDCGLYILNDGRYALNVYENGRLRTALRGKLDLDMDIGGSMRLRNAANSSARLAYGGGRLAVCDWSGGTVVVLDTSGLSYIGRLDGIRVYGYPANPTEARFETK